MGRTGRRIEVLSRQLTAVGASGVDGLVDPRWASRTVAPYAGKTVLITGANRGIGLGFVEALTAEGARVVAACRDPAKADKLKSMQPQPIIVKLDVASEESINALPAQLKQQGITSLDYLINNAGISVPNHPVDPILEARPALMREVMNVNVIGTVHVTQQCLPFLEQGSSKVIINLSSQLASMTNCWSVQGRKGGVSSYRLSRAAGNMAVRCFGGELAEQGYIFISMSPGHVATDMGSAGGRKPPLTVEQSVGGILKIACRLTQEDNGCFLQYDGSELPW